MVVAWRDADRSKARARMVERDLRPRGIQDEAVLEAMVTVPRERFVPESLERHAYDDGALPIAEGQTISQPYIVAAMAQAGQVKPGDQVLEIGTGSGYGAGILAAMGARVVSVERHEGLARAAATVLAELGLEAEVVVGDGSVGWPAEAPYDAILVTAAAPSVPEALIDQLAPEGRLVVPVGGLHSGQKLLRVRRDPDGHLIQENLGLVAFVPLVGDQGFPAIADYRP